MVDHEYKKKTVTITGQQEDIARREKFKIRANMSAGARNVRNEAYSDFLYTLSTPPFEMEGPTTKSKSDSLGYKQRKRAKAEFEEIGAKHTLISMEDMEKLNSNRYLTNASSKKDWLKSKTRQSEITNEESLQRLKNGDYSNFENVPKTIKNIVASQAFVKFISRDDVFDPNCTEWDVVKNYITDYGVTSIMNPALRLGISLALNSDGLTDWERRRLVLLDEMMTNTIMLETLIKQVDVEQYEKDLVEHGEKKENAREIAEKEVGALQAQQVEIAKRLLLMQLSNFKVYDEQGNSAKWPYSMAFALSHCRRVVLTMPKGNTEWEEHKMFDTIFHSHNNTLALDQKRTASTHDIKRRKVGTTGPTEEVKVKTGNFTGQRGMNCAIGGLGNIGIGGQLIRNDGSCGHFYSMYKSGKSGKYGAILFGMESDASGMTNQMGHKHTMMATAEAASSFGGQRVDEIGAAYGGRQCDLTHLTANKITKWMNLLQISMNYWQITNDTDSRDRVMEMLAGRQMDAEQLDELWNIMNDVPWIGETYL